MRIIFSKFIYIPKVCVNPDCNHKGLHRHRLGAGQVEQTLYKAFMCVYCYAVHLEIDNAKNLPFVQQDD